MHLLPVLLFAIGFLFLTLELLIEQKGLLGMMGVCFIMLAAFIGAFSKGPLAVWIVFVIILILLFILYKMLKKGKSCCYQEYLFQKAEESSRIEKELDNRFYMGKTGVALEDLNPSGRVDFDGPIRKVESSGKYIAKGKMVKVIDIKENRLFVTEIKRV